VCQVQQHPPRSSAPAARGQSWRPEPPAASHQPQLAAAELGLKAVGGQGDVVGLQLDLGKGTLTIFLYEETKEVATSPILPRPPRCLRARCDRGVTDFTAKSLWYSADTS
jgi:hypothetical protein